MPKTSRVKTFLNCITSKEKKTDKLLASGPTRSQIQVFGIRGSQ